LLVHADQAGLGRRGQGAEDEGVGHAAVLVDLLDVAQGDGLSVQFRHLGRIAPAPAEEAGRALVAAAADPGEDENGHRQNRQGGQKRLLPLAEELEGVESHYQSSTYVTAGPPWPGAGLDTRPNAVVWERGGLSSK